jgi:hypothetical protein
VGHGKGRRPESGNKRGEKGISYGLLDQPQDDMLNVLVVVLSESELAASE